MTPTIPALWKHRLEILDTLADAPAPGIRLYKIRFDGELGTVAVLRLSSAARALFQRALGKDPRLGTIAFATSDNALWVLDVGKSSEKLAKALRRIHRSRTSSPSRGGRTRGKGDKPRASGSPSRGGRTRGKGDKPRASDSRRSTDDLDDTGAGFPAPLDLGVEPEDFEWEECAPPDFSGSEPPIGAPGAPSSSLPEPLTDEVVFTLAAPAALVRGEPHILEIWAHLENERDAVLERARELQEGEPSLISRDADAPIARGAVITVQLKISGIDLLESTDTLTWRGKKTNATFPVLVPDDAKLGKALGRADFLLDGLSIGRLDFILRVVDKPEPAADPLTALAVRYRSVFASYASVDDVAVRGRLQMVNKLAPSLDIFLDIDSLRSGQRWKDELEKAILQRDILYLFWSPAAKASCYVEWEWKTALAKRGLQGIDPVPLVPPFEDAAPPEELRDLHFNDRWIMFKPRH